MSVKLDPVIGLPPSSTHSNNIMLNSMPVLEITPCEPEFEQGLAIFKLREKWEKYSKILNYHGYDASGSPLKVAFQADNFPLQDSFTNDYGESFLNKISDAVSSGTAELTQFTGERTLSGSLSKIGNAAGQIGGKFGNSIKDAIESAKGGAKAVADRLNLSDKTLNLMNNLAAGGRIDFPMVWKSSQYAPSYSFNIRLFNPDVNNKEATEKYIIGPLAALLLLASPITEDGSTYNWPFFHKITCKGLLQVTSGMITNLTVSKGGENQQVSFGQVLGLVDVRLEFACLYRSMMAGDVNYENNDRPTLKNYLETLKEGREIQSTTGSENERLETTKINLKSSLANSVPNVISEGATAITNRVDSMKRIMADDLTSKMPKIAV